MLKFFKKIFKLSKRELGLPDSINTKIEDLLNTLIKSEQIQGMTFKVSSNCDKVSVLNDIEFCDEVSASDSYESTEIDQACVDTCKVAKDAAYGVCDATRQTCNTGCDGLKVGYDACCGTCDATRKTCKSFCFGSKKCENSCDDASSKCKNGCDDAFPYKSCNDACNKASSDCKSGADSMYNSCVSGCKSLDITGGYEFRLEYIKGVGGIVVTDVSNIQLKPNSTTEFSIDLDVVVPEVNTMFYYKIWQDPIPAIKGEMPVIAKSVKGSGTGTLVYDAEAEGGPCYYLQLDTLKITIPSNVFDSNAITKTIQSIGMSVDFITAGIVDLNKELLDLANGTLSDVVLKELNDILKDMPIN